jgi:RNA polymerase-binding transcription factor DksA
VPTYDRAQVEATLTDRAEQLRRARIAVRAEGDGMLSSELSHTDNHPADEATQTHEHELEVTTEVYIDEEEARVREALHALADGTYGTCHDCGVQIPPARLMAQPTAIRCVECQRRFEGAHRQRAVSDSR